MDNPRRIATNIVLAFSIIIALHVYLFWLRELDLTFLATYRLLIIPLVILAGVALGIYSSSRSVSRPSHSFGDGYPFVFGFYIALSVGIVFTAVILIQNAIVTYLTVASQAHIQARALTYALFDLLILTFTTASLGYYLARMAWQIRKKHLEQD